MIANSPILSKRHVRGFRYTLRNVITSYSIHYTKLYELIGTARERFSIKFYLIAMLFIVFDLECVFLYPWAVMFKRLGMFGFVEMGVFIVIV